jgi:hypothetical protein
MIIERAHFQVRRDPARQRFNVYFELPPDPHTGERRFMTRGRDGAPPEIHNVALGNEPPLWDWFPEEIARELGEALAPRPDVTERHLDDAIEVRDRLLTVLESEHLHGSNDPRTIHIGAEAELRRHPLRRV